MSNVTPTLLPEGQPDKQTGDDEISLLDLFAVLCRRAHRNYRR
jgi:hypothetical protein